MSAALPIVWMTLAVITFVAAVRASQHPAALRAGRLAVAALYLVAGAAVNAAYVVTGEDYDNFADGSPLAFVRDTWRSLVVPNHVFFISLLVLFEAAVGLLVLSGGRRAELGFVGAIGFHVALMSFGWGFCLWSIPMLVALSLLLRAQHREVETAEPLTPVSAARRAGMVRSAW